MADEKRSRYTEAQNKATQKYIKENLDEIKFRVRKGEKDRYKAAAEKAGLSMAKFFLTAADKQIGGMPSSGPQDAAGAPAGAGVVSLSPFSLNTAQEAAQSAGETVSQFIERAVSVQAQRDKSSLALGINPTTGDKLEKEA